VLRGKSLACATPRAQRRSERGDYARIYSFDRESLRVDSSVDIVARFAETRRVKRLPSKSVAIASFTFLAAPGFGADRSADEAAIRALEARQPEAWNKHDAKAYASLFTEDGDCVNIVGWWWKGRAEIEKKLTDAYVYVFKESALTVTNVDIRFLNSDTAVAHVRWTLSGARTPAGIPVPQQGLQTHVLQKQNGQWLIAAFQNTLSVPEMPFPKGPVAPPPAAKSTP
jgi:uncharacterized protein (TIGR02246 family)